MSPVLYIEGCTSPCTVHRPGALQKCSHQPLISPVLYTSLECFRSAPISYESRTSEKRTENKVKQKVNIRGYPGISPGRFVHCQYRNQSVSTLCTCEKQSVSVTHGQFYVGVSRVTSVSNIKVIWEEKIREPQTQNIVYKEVL